MFKKIMLMILAVAGISTVAMAKDVYERSASVLPKAAQTVLAKNFDSKVNLVKIDREYGRIKDYEVILNDGTEVTFDRKGIWENIEVASSKSVPISLIPASIVKYINEKVPGQVIVGIEKESYGYEVELANGLEYKFNHKGQFIRYDD